MATGDYWVCGTQGRGTVDKLEVSDAGKLMMLATPRAGDKRQWSLDII